MPYPQIFDMPIESGLKLVAVIGSYGVDKEGKSLDNMVNKLDGRVLIMALVDLQGSDPCRIIDSRILETLQLLPLWFFERQELDINLNVMSWDLLLAALSLHRATLSIAGESIQTLASQDTVSSALGNFQLRVIALNVQANLFWSQVVSCS
jgi:hypothetical protein